MGSACSNCTTKDDESQYEMSEQIDTANFGGASGNNPANNNLGGSLLPKRVAIQSQRLEELPNRFKGGQYMLDQSNQ